jgi:hypothetical protein
MCISYQKKILNCSTDILNTYMDSKFYTSYNVRFMLLEYAHIINFCTFSLILKIINGNYIPVRIELIIHTKTI